MIWIGDSYERKRGTYHDFFAFGSRGKRGTGKRGTYHDFLEFGA